MGNEQYNVKIDDALMTFEFTSESPKGSIKKRVQYRKIDEQDVYNLAFGDVNETTNDFDDSVVTSNGDTLEVLTTVASTVYTFTRKYPNAIVYAEGSNEARNRLYRVGISRHLEKLKEEFHVAGFLADIGWVIYEKDKDYSAFFIKRKD